MEECEDFRRKPEGQPGRSCMQSKCQHQRKVTTIPRFCHDCEVYLGAPTPLTEDFVWAFWLYKAKNLMTTAVDACVLPGALIQQVNRKEIEEAKNHFYGVLEMGSRDWNLSMEEQAIMDTFRYDSTMFDPDCIDCRKPDSLADFALCAKLGVICEARTQSGEKAAGQTMWSTAIPQLLSVSDPPNTTLHPASGGLRFGSFRDRMMDKRLNRMSRAELIPEPLNIPAKANKTSPRTNAGGNTIPVKVIPNSQSHGTHKKGFYRPTLEDLYLDDHDKFEPRRARE